MLFCLIAFITLLLLKHWDICMIPHFHIKNIKIIIKIIIYINNIMKHSYQNSNLKIVFIAHIFCSFLIIL